MTQTKRETRHARMLNKRASGAFEPGELVELSLFGLTSRWWTVAGAFSAPAVRAVVLTQRNVYLLRRRGWSSSGWEVVVKYPRGSVRPTFTGHRLQVGPDHAVSLIIGNTRRWKGTAGRLAARANEGIAASVA